MEHSALHALQLIGLIIALGGAFLIVAFLRPALRSLGPNSARDDFSRRLRDTIAQWVVRGALTAAMATLADLFVQVAEVQGKTIFGGVDLALVVRFATQTTVGQLSVARAALLLLAAGAGGLASERKWSIVIALGMSAVVCTSLVSHAAAQPTGRLLAIASQIAHIGAAAAWMGVLVHLLAVRPQIQRLTDSPSIALIADIVRRFSPLALTAVVLMSASGVLAAVRYLATPGALLTSAYGLTLIVKLVLLTPVVVAGSINFRIIRPALLKLAASPVSATPVLRRFGKMLELEVTAGLLAITVAGVVASVSPPGDDGSLQLTPLQVHALLSPDLPSTAFVDPSAFVGAPTRTVDDLRYSEFTHNWSGVFVIFLGLFWLLQSWGGLIGARAARCWPLLLLPLAAFIAVFADPDIWLVRQIGFWDVVSDPQILEHNFGALLVLTMVWLGWRDHGRPATQRPLGYALPIIMIIGSVLLLGHAHSSLRASDDLTNLINVQHAILGALGLFAGAVRWLSLRGLIPQRSARLVWPALVIGLGLFMAFCYREVV